MKSYEERIAELDAKREQKEKELAQLKARQKKLQQQQKALEKMATAIPPALDGGLRLPKA